MNTIFKTGFSAFVVMGDAISAECEGFTITATLHQDDTNEAPDKRDDGFWPSLDPNKAGYIGQKSRRTLARHMTRANMIMQAWREGEWSYCGVAVTVSRNDIQLTGDYHHAIWGCDYNYPCASKRHENHRHDYLLEYANEHAAEALDDAKTKLAALCAAAAE